MRKVIEYENILNTYPDNAEKALTAIWDMPVIKLVDFIRYCSDQIENPTKGQPVKTYRVLRHKALLHIEDSCTKN